MAPLWGADVHVECPGPLAAAAAAAVGEADGDGVGDLFTHHSATNKCNCLTGYIQSRAESIPAFSHVREAIGIAVNDKSSSTTANARGVNWQRDSLVPVIPHLEFMDLRDLEHWSQEGAELVKVN